MVPWKTTYNAGLFTLFCTGELGFTLEGRGWGQPCEPATEAGSPGLLEEGSQTQAGKASAITITE